MASNSLITLDNFDIGNVVIHETQKAKQSYTCNISYRSKSNDNSPLVIELPLCRSDSGLVKSTLKEDELCMVLKVEERYAAAAIKFHALIEAIQSIVAREKMSGHLARSSTLADKHL